MTRPDAVPEDNETDPVLSFSRRLLRSRLPENRLSPMEERLLALFRALFADSVLVARLNRMDPQGGALPLVDGEIVAEGARFALAAAIEIEAPLREIRDRMEKG